MKTLTPTLHLATPILVARCLPACDHGAHSSCDRDEDCDAEQVCMPYYAIDDDGGACEDLGDVGDDCHFETDCRSDLVCLGRSMDASGKTSHGECAHPAGPGEPCLLDVDCRPRAPGSRLEGPAFCDENGATPVCRENGTTPDGDACEGHVECGEGSLCPDGEAGRTCVPADGTLGSACLGARENVDCDAGLYCDGDPVNAGFCRAPVVADGACLGGECVEGFECNVDGRCQALPEGAIRCWSDAACPAEQGTPSAGAELPQQTPKAAHGSGTLFTRDEGPPELNWPGRPMVELRRR